MSIRNITSRLFQGHGLLSKTPLLPVVPQRLPYFRIQYSFRYSSTSNQYGVNRIQRVGGESWVIAEKCKEEEFVDIPSDVFNGKLSGWKVSRDGRIKTSRGAFSGPDGKGNLSKVLGEVSGYYWAKICGKQYRVHRLVALTFLGKEKEVKEQKFPGKQLDVDHIDGDKQNNSVDNLQWLTRQEHVEKTVASQVYPRPNFSSALCVYLANSAAGFERTFPSMSSCAKFLKTSTGGKLSTARLFDNPDGVKLKGWRVRIDDRKFQVQKGELFRRLFGLHGQRGRVVLVLDPPSEDLGLKHYIEVSNLGRVRFPNGRISTGRMMKGYLYSKGFLVHRLVAEAFHSEHKKALVAAGVEESTLQ
eukprot:Cvel_1474.t1-p1 / transcript=Cvel_1474.t1 / gene=Cvel_1474 / organism=Chromera_velia_CCMP2878 / gene_product=hypothetical protein / transcript_product=hypothetical protein / location=Cvel_scaffold52:6830-7903(-) / protein_length=358 / sequence_SO=supercontig / SO=protein_coding / is_pseudo=false